jgi:hypothetical protein
VENPDGAGGADDSQRLKNYRGEALWPELRESLNEGQGRLEAAREAAVAGPIRFEPIGSQYRTR